MSKPTVDKVLPLVWAYYAKSGNGGGGNLHIVLDDGNLSNDDIQWCRAYAVGRNDADGIALADLLLQMSATQRSKVYKHVYDEPNP